MSNTSEIEAMRYLLGELDREERLAFEQRVETDPSLAQVLCETREALAVLAVESTKAEPLAATVQRESLAQIMAVVDAEPRVSTLKKSLRRWAWPLAASILFGLNCWQYMGSGGVAGSDADQVVPLTTAIENVSLVQGDSERESGEVVATELADSLFVAEPSSGGASESTAESDVVPVRKNELQRLREIYSEYEQLAYVHERLRGEHVEIIEQLANHLLPEPDLNRLAAMELVDPASYATGERKGLLDFALNLLTEPGIVALNRSTAVTGGADGGRTAVNVVDTAGAVVGDGTQVDDPSEPTPVPYAWSVYDEVQARGFLNLYDLPTPLAGESMQLWVRPAADEAYVRVGEIPEEFHGGSGSLTYTLPDSSMPPAEILVTTEPTEAIPAEPVGVTVLRGP